MRLRENARLDMERYEAKKAYDRQCDLQVDASKTSLISGANDHVSTVNEKKARGSPVFYSSTAMTPRIPTPSSKHAWKGLPPAAGAARGGASCPSSQGGPGSPRCRLDISTDAARLARRGSQKAIPKGMFGFMCWHVGVHMLWGRARLAPQE